MSVIGEAALSSLLEAAFSSVIEGLSGTLTSSDLLKIFQQEQVHVDLNKWENTLRKIDAVLNDAETKRETSGLVKIWLDELEDLAYDADDILDEFATEVLRRKLNAKPSTSRVRKYFIPACCMGFNPSSIKFFANMRTKIADIDTRLQIIVTETNGLDLIKSTGGRTGTERLNWVPTAPDLYEDDNYGREDDKKNIINLLKSSEFSDAKLSVIPIVGMGGLGKTTLAQLVYSDDDVSSYFDLKAWVCVSENFDIATLTKAILQSITLEHCDTNDLPLIQVKLRRKLDGMKFLLILDDVWNKDYAKWHTLSLLFKYVAQGSTIIVTTREHRVAEIMATTPAYQLKELSSDDCWRVFIQHAQWSTYFVEHPEFEKIRRDILDRCKGSPLAAKVLGGALHNVHEPNEWKNVLNSKIWKEEGIIPVLKLSYQYLPSHLKRCFAYCSLFPKDYEFEKNELVLLWIAEGLVQETKINKSIEDLGVDYFRELLMRSFFQQSRNNESLFVMHDLIHDLAERVARDLCYRIEDKLDSNQQSEISTKVRHFSYTQCPCDSIKKFECLCDGIKKFENLRKDMHLRTFLPLPRKFQSYLTNYVPNCILPQLRCLRVLSLCGYNIFELPSSIGEMKHLRYLSLSNTPIRSLPESTSSLHNLQTLMLKGCHKLTKLPEKIRDLVNLRYLDITNANLIREMPVGIEKLKNLHTLSNFIVGKDNGSKIGDLMNLEFLQGRLCISSLENVLDVEDARRANLNDKKNLDALEIKWGSGRNHLQDAGIAKDILDILRPSTAVKKLSIHGYIGVNFPTWLGDHSFSHIVDLKIVGCAICISLPAVGHLPNLKFLAIKSMSMVLTIGPEFYGEDFLKSFQNLETLHFEDMQEWQDWIPCGVEYGGFPRLREFFISQCPKLQGELPRHLPSLEKFSISNCEQLVVSIPSLPTLHELKIVGCKEVVSNNIEELCLLESITFSIPGLKSLSKEFMEGLAKVKILKIDNCNELTSLWQDSLISLVRLEIQSCPSLVNIHLASTLNTLTIRGCGALNSLPMSNCTCLEYATIEECSSLMFISKRQLPPTLKRLEIKNCVNLQFLIDEGEASSLSMKEESINSNASLLEHLVISDCPSLKCIPLRGDLFVKLKLLQIGNCSELTSLSSSNQLPIALKRFDVENCPKLESLANDLHNNMSLEYLRIDSCSLVSFPDGGFLRTHLTYLEIRRCKKLKALPHMPMVTNLQIDKCPSIVSLPEGGLPTNLKVLSLGGMTICKQVFEWGLRRLTSLTHLTICGNGFKDWQSFPEEEDGKMLLLLPTSLTSLWIREFPDIVFLSSKVFEDLSSLEELWIGNCPKLASLPENGLPPSLLQLRIFKCPVLKQHCKKGKGQEWLKNIINIPCVEIDFRSIYELQEEEQQ